MAPTNEQNRICPRNRDYPLCGLLPGMVCKLAAAPFTRVAAGDVAQLDKMSQELHEAEETRDQAITYLQQRLHGSSVSKLRPLYQRLSRSSSLAFASTQKDPLAVISRFQKGARDLR